MEPLPVLDASSVIQECFFCPSGDCGLSQHHNGLIAWCEAGHVYALDKADARRDKLEAGAA